MWEVIHAQGGKDRLVKTWRTEWSIMHTEPLPVAMRRTDFFDFSAFELCEWMVVGIAVGIAQARLRRLLL
jgi:hypothetical protein